MILVGWWNFSEERTFFASGNGEFQVDKDRIEGLAEQIKGKMKVVAGKMTGDSKLENEGKTNSISTILLQPRSWPNY